MSKIKRKDVVSARNALAEIANKNLPVKLGYAVAKNLRLAKSECEEMRASIAAFEKSDELKAYHEARINLCQKHAEKDEKGKPIIEGNVYRGVEGNKEFEGAIEALKEEHREVLARADQLDEEYKALLEEETEINFHEIEADKLDGDVTLPPRLLEPLIGVIII